MTAKQKPPVPSSDMPWYKQTHFLIAMIIIALLVGMHFGPNDSNASIAPPPSIETPTIQPTIEPAPVAPAPIIEVHAPAPTPPAPVTVVNVIGQNETPQIIRELQPIIYRAAPEPKPIESKPEPEPIQPTAKSSADERCQRLLKEHREREAAIRRTMASYHP